ncbi:MAG: hypothetical protein EBV65_08270 [Gammaproteobacteria bacterium]|nr:hypothetical protein [Gammaproteobacteria bacterium]
MPIPHRRIRGKLLYTSDHAGREGAERGREYFTFSVRRPSAATLKVKYSRRMDGGRCAPARKSTTRRTSCATSP